MNVLVRWLQTGNLFKDGVADQRHKGDEDIMPEIKARSYRACGLVQILGPAEVTTVVTDVKEDEPNEDLLEEVMQIETCAEEFEDTEDYECLS